MGEDHGMIWQQYGPIRKRVQQELDDALTADEKYEIFLNYEGQGIDYYFHTVVAAKECIRAFIEEDYHQGLSYAVMTCQMTEETMDVWQHRKPKDEAFIKEERESLLCFVNDMIFQKLGKSEKDIVFVPQNTIITFPREDKSIIGHCWLDPCISVTLQQRNEEGILTGVRYAAHFDVKADREEIRKFAKELAAGGKYDLLMVGGSGNGGGTAPLHRDILRIFNEEGVSFHTKEEKVGRREHFNNFIVTEEFKDIGIAQPVVSDEAKKRFQLENVIFGVYELSMGDQITLSMLSGHRPIHQEIHDMDSKELVPHTTYDTTKLKECLSLTDDVIQGKYKNPAQAAQNMEVLKHYRDVRDKLAPIIEQAMQESKVMQLKKPSGKVQDEIKDDVMTDLLGYAYAINPENITSQMKIHLMDKAKERISTHPAIEQSISVISQDKSQEMTR